MMGGEGTEASVYDASGPRRIGHLDEIASSLMSVIKGGKHFHFRKLSLQEFQKASRYDQRRDHPLF
jgi:hypothetical protein